MRWILLKLEIILQMLLITVHKSLMNLVKSLFDKQTVEVVDT